MEATAQGTELSPVAQQALNLYETELRSLLEPEFSGQAVAIHVDTRDYEVAATHSAAARALLARRPADGRIVTLTIGPPSDADLRLTSRMQAGLNR